MVKARTQNGGEWSALTEAFFQADGVPSVAPGDLAISEIHYNPSGSDELEFIELMNIAGPRDQPARRRLHNGHPLYVLPADAALAPYQRVIVLVKNLVEANAAYGLRLAGRRGLRRQSRQRRRRAHVRRCLGSPVQDFAYDDASPLPTQPDGGGASLVSSARLNPDHGDALSWRASLGGPSPGTGDLGAAEFADDPDGDSDGNAS
ncbi:MAG: hypothetical protein R3F11_00540 [Verrucomicrobiales bacterium]